MIAQMEAVLACTATSWRSRAPSPAVSPHSIGSGRASCKGRPAACQPSLPSGYQLTLRKAVTRRPFRRVPAHPTVCETVKHERLGSIAHRSTCPASCETAHRPQPSKPRVRPPEAKCCPEYRNGGAAAKAFQASCLRAAAAPAARRSAKPRAARPVHSTHRYAPLGRLLRCRAPAHGNCPYGNLQAPPQWGRQSRHAPARRARAPPPAHASRLRLDGLVLLVEERHAIVGQHAVDRGLLPRDRLVDAASPFRLVGAHPHGDAKIQAR